VSFPDFGRETLLDQEHKDLVLGMLDNLIAMFERFKVIPNASRTYLMGRSQPPFLTSFIRDCYETYNLDLDWLKLEEMNLFKAAEYPA
jgi:alpha,alpha-trehalase